MQRCKTTVAVLLACLWWLPSSSLVKAAAAAEQRTQAISQAAPNQAAAKQEAAEMSHQDQLSAAFRVAAALNSATAEEAVDLATTEVMAFIDSAQGYAKQEPERFFSEVEALMGPLIDFDRFARNVMGPYFREATPEQRSVFAQSFKSSLVRTYALALTEFHDGRVTVLPPRRKPRNPDAVKVTQEIEYAGRTYQVVYDVRRKDGAWNLRNMVIEGVNVGLSFKSQFASAMKGPEYEGDLDQVIAAWGKFVAGEKAADAGSKNRETEDDSRAVNS